MWRCPVRAPRELRSSRLLSLRELQEALRRRRHRQRADPSRRGQDHPRAKTSCAPTSPRKAARRRSARSAARTSSAGAGPNRRRRAFGSARSTRRSTARPTSTSGFAPSPPGRRSRTTGSSASRRVREGEAVSRSRARAAGVRGWWLGGVEVGRLHARVDNPWYPLTPGSSYGYQGDKDGEPSREVMTVTRRTKMIDGAPCVVVRTCST